MGITKANVFTNSIPLFTALFSFMLLGEKLTLQNITGMVIVIAGILMSQMNGRKQGCQRSSGAYRKNCLTILFCYTFLIIQPFNNSRIFGMIE